MSVSVHINWILLLSGFFILCGLAVILAFLSLKVFAFCLRKDIHCRSFEIHGFNKWMTAGLVLILLGIVFYFFKLPTNRLIAKKLMDSQEIELFDSFDQIYFRKEMLSIDENNKRLKNDECLPLIWRGYVSLPYMRLAEGTYVFEFQARGTATANRARNRQEYAKFEVEFEVETSKGYLELKKIMYVELSKDYKRYKMTAVLEKENIAKFQISFYKNLAKLRDGRLAWIKNIGLRKIISE